jgi:heme-degrading monooxygenase HmoA
MSQPQSTIVTGDEILTLINTFTCADVRQNELIDAIDRATREVFVKLDGFISASVHASLDRTRVINYVQWRSVEDFDNAELHADVRKNLDEIMAIAESADPRLFHVKAVHHS